MPVSDLEDKQGEAMKHYDVIHIGNYTKDTIIKNGITTYVDGGGFNYGARATVTFMDKVAVITKLSEEDSRVIDKLKENKIDTYPVFCKNSTEVTLNYYSDNPDEREILITAEADPFDIEDLEGLSADAYILAPSIKGEVPFNFIDDLSKTDSLVAIDAQGYIRVREGDKVVYAEWTEAETIFPLIDILKVDIAEAEFITSLSDRYEAVKKLYAMGAGEIILTYRDGAVVYDGKNLYEEKFRPEELRGRSGRGDTCISSYSAARLTKAPAEALKWAVALTSLKLEKEGPFDRSSSEVEKLIAEKY